LKRTLDRSAPQPDVTEAVVLETEAISRISGKRGQKHSTMPRPVSQSGKQGY